MNYRLLFDENLYEINEKIVDIIEFCKRRPSKEKIDERFNGLKELNELIDSGVLIMDNGIFHIADNVKISKSPNVLAAISFCFGFQCNLNCKHCYSRIILHDKRERMNAKQAEFITEAIIQINPMSVRLGGGETLMRKDFITTMDSLSQAGISASFTTNGWYLSKKLAKQLSLLKNIEPTRLSIHGIGKSHDDFTGVNGSFKKLMEAQKNLKEIGLEHEFVIVLNIHTQNKMKNFIDLAENIGVNKIQFRALAVAGNATVDQEISFDNYRKAYAFVQEENKKRNINVDFAPNALVAKHLNMQEKCLCGINQLTIRPSGDISACNLFFKPIGNVFKDSLTDIWENHPELLKIRKGACPCEVAEQQRIMR